MTIGIDLAPLQSPHRYRGIGSVLRNLINHIPDEIKKGNSFIFFVQSNKKISDPQKVLSLKGVNYEVRYYQFKHKDNLRLPGKLNLIVKGFSRLTKLFEMRLGSSCFKKEDIADLDYFLQVDPISMMPKSTHKLKKILFVHDLIPYILEWDYLWNYSTARKHNFSRKASLKVSVRRKLFIYEYKLQAKNADLLVANSQQTKNDFIKYLHIPNNKIVVAVLGININNALNTDRKPDYRYIDTSWGYIPFNFSFPISQPFLLFVGGADHRRKLQDLVTAFNHLRASGVNINLVLAGDSMKGPMDIANEEIQMELRSSSYLEDIIFLGYVDENILRWLYAHALCFVFPSMYEGFGLPVLEAMSYGCPVISYPNPAILEIADKVPLYATNYYEIVTHVYSLLNKKDERELRAQLGIKQSAKYPWSKTTEILFKYLFE